MDEPQDSALSGEDQLPLHNIESLEQEASLERLELGTPIGLNLLDEIAAIFGKVQAVPEIEQLKMTIKEVKGTLRAERVIVGVVGDTGAGKSSVINALLDEECIVPTNCMRACTAVITEIQFNESTDQARRYRAEVEFIRYVGTSGVSHLSKHQLCILWQPQQLRFNYSFCSWAHCCSETVLRD